MINRHRMTSLDDSSTAPARQVVRHLSVVILVSMLVATLFTAWTPASVLPQRSAVEIGAAVATRASVATQAVALTAVPLPTSGAVLPPAPTEPPRPRIGIVAGHKGNDSGAVCPDGITEAEVNLDIATRVKVALEASGFEVDLLDEYDARLTGYQALALVSIHADSCDYINDLATGYKVAAALDSPVPDKAMRLVACLTDRYALSTGMPFHEGSITYDMTQYHSFYEIDVQTPAAIIETGFLNLDREILTKRPEVVAQGIIDGIICYARNEPVPRNPATTVSPP